MKLQVLARERIAGLTLVELLVAMTLLAMGAIAGLTIIIQAQKTNTFARTKTVATNAAQQQMETIFMNAPSAVGTYAGQSFPVGDLVRPGGGNAGLIAVDMTQTPRIVTISVAWQGRGKLEPGQITLRALRSEATR